MGTSMAFYLIENRGLPRRTLQERMDTFRPQALADQRDMRELFKAFMSEEVFEELQRGMRMGNAAQRQDNIIPFPGTTMQEEIPKPQWQKGPVLAWREEARWFPFFEETLCDGYNASSRDAEQLAKGFGVPVLAFSIFDSDVLFVSYADPERKLRLDFAKADFEEAEEMIEAPFRGEFPSFLCTYGDETILREIWEGEEVFADDRMAKLCTAIGARVLYDAVDMPEGYERIE